MLIYAALAVARSCFYCAWTFWPDTFFSADWKLFSQNLTASVSMERMLFPEFFVETYQRRDTFEFVAFVMLGLAVIMAKRFSGGSSRTSLEQRDVG